MTLEDLKNKFYSIVPNRTEVFEKIWWEGYASALADHEIITEEVFDEFCRFLIKYEDD